MKLKLIILNCPINSLPDNEFAQFLYGRLLGFRAAIFQKNFDQPIFPFFADDMVSDYIALCDVDDNYCPLFSYRVVSLSRVLEHGLHFPLFEYLQKSDDKNSELERILKFCPADKLLYVGSLFVNKSKVRPIFRDLKSIMHMTTTKFFEEFDEILAMASVKNTADKLGHINGFVDLFKEPINVGGYGLATLVRYVAPTLEALEATKKYSELWDDRLIIRPQRLDDIHNDHLPLLRTFAPQCEGVNYLQAVESQI